MKPQIIKRLLVPLVAGTLFTLSPPSWAGVVFTEDFNGYANSTSSSSQYQTALNVYMGGNLPLWTATGGTDVLAVDRSGAGNYALPALKGQCYEQPCVHECETKERFYAY